MSSKDNCKSPAGMWQACNSMEVAAVAKLSVDLGPFKIALEKCYEAGGQAPTLPGKRHGGNDLLLAALFLKRSLNDLRSIWTQTLMGYTSQAASVAAALFEHALAVEAMAGSTENAKQLRETNSGDLPWSPIELAKLHASNMRLEAQVTGTPFTDADYELAWREVYGAYKFLCKIKHPTIRSTLHDAPAASVRDGEYVVMAAPDLRAEDLPVKATILMIAVSRAYQAIRWFALNLGCDTTEAYYRDFTDRMAAVVPAARDAYKQLVAAPLPFDVSDELLAEEYRDLKHKQARSSD